ncbi:hypothetical protein GW17_00054732 [Ensete ventricosum]|nr:hypothetical protein GW17_00054732 [Ensete ventricosum]
MAAMQLASPTPTLSWHNFSVTRTLYGGDAVGFSDAHPLLAQLLRHEDSVWRRCSWLLRRPPSPGTTSPSREEIGSSKKDLLVDYSVMYLYLSGKVVVSQYLMGASPSIELWVRSYIERRFRWFPGS